MVKINKKGAGSILNNVPEDKVFRVNDGRILGSLQELGKALGEMGDETFKYHVNKDRNDFKNWIEFVIGDKSLARNISKTKIREAMMKKVNARISSLGSLSKK